MKRIWILTLAIGPLLAQHHNRDLDWDHHDQETIQRTFHFSAGGDRKLVIDNVSGYIHVTGTNGSEVQVNLVRHNRADSPERMNEAKSRVKVDITQEGNTVRFFEDGPFRTSNDNVNYQGDKHYHYSVDFDYDVQVPKDIQLVLKNFNHGDIQVKGTSGHYDVHGFNGGISMEDIAGYGDVHTFNGGVKVSYSRNPDHACNFHTFNGAIDVYFLRDLNAELQFKTFHGGVFTDFEVMPAAVQTSGRLDGKFSYKSGRSSMGRIGKGGALLAFHGFNGAIRLHEKN